MIITCLSGGLGNQMFQYTIAKYYHVRGARSFIDLKFYSNQTGDTNRKYELSIFKTTVPTLPKFYCNYLYSDHFIWKNLRLLNVLSLKDVKEQSLKFDGQFLNLTNSILFGYFQNPRYFASIQSELREDFDFILPLSKESLAYANDISNSNSISIHIRRGDYFTNELVNKKHGILPLAYYEKAVRIIQNKIINPRFFIFSDDQQWIQDNFQKITENFVSIGCNVGDNSWQDMCLMSKCKHNITANSSFSWWGAWLNKNQNKIVISPAQWCADQELSNQLKNIVPDSWHKIEINKW